MKMSESNTSLSPPDSTGELTPDKTMAAYDEDIWNKIRDVRSELHDAVAGYNNADNERGQIIEVTGAHEAALWATLAEEYCLSAPIVTYMKQGVEKLNEGDRAEAKRNFRVIIGKCACSIGGEIERVEGRFLTPEDGSPQDPHKVTAFYANVFFFGAAIENMLDRMMEEFDEEA